VADLTEQRAPTEVSRSVAAAARPAPTVGPIKASNPVPRVAVIGVHGVAHHDPGATANAMADLLLSLPASDHDAPRYYGSFRSSGIQVPLQRLRVRSADTIRTPTRLAKTFAFLQERSSDLAYMGTQHAALSPGQNIARGSSGREYMRLLLQDYAGGANGDAYVTTRLEGDRAPNAPGGAAEAHIYEVLWADLARPTNSFLSFLLSLFQLILHLGSLSRLAIDSGAAENSGWKWRTYCSMQRYAVRMLQIPIPVIKVILLIALFSCVPALLQSTQDEPWFPLVLGGVAGLVATLLINRYKSGTVTISPILWTLRAIFPVAAGVALAALILKIPSAFPNALSAFECWLIMGAALLYYVLKKYEDVRKGVQIIGWLLLGLSLAMFSTYLVVPAMNAGSVPQATLWTVTWILAALRASWMLLFGFSFAALVLGSLAWRSIPETQPDRRARARAAVRTSRFALALPSLLFLLVTTLLWTGMFSIARGIQEPFFEARFLSLPPGGRWLARYHLVPDPEKTKSKTEKICDKDSNPSCLKTNLARVEPLAPEAYRELVPTNDSKGQLSQVHPIPDGKPDNARPEYLKDILVWSVGTGFPLTLILFGLALFLLFWWALPGVLTEKFPLRGQAEPPRTSTNAESVRLGTWLSRGLDATSMITFLFWCAIFLVPTIYVWGLDQPSWLGSATRYIVQSFAASVSAAALAIVVKYGSPVLSAILDVDTYLRASPEKATPRAKIAERYVSLLRYITRYRSADGRGYDSVVIVAHSLGTLISADLLRFLKEVGDPELAALGLAGRKVANQGNVAIRLLTMGSPIRQLLNRFFPYLYDWVRDQPDNGLRPLPDPAKPPAPMPSPAKPWAPIAPDALPDPADLGVTEWVNTYRSGDYVGRSLWLDEWYCRTMGPADQGEYPQPIYKATAGARSEACIGAGAHTHYWDDTAPDVAELLDQLIV